MPIYPENLRTRKAAVDGQYDDSGGRIHPTEYVVHHEVGGLLPKLTEIDHAGGRVDLAKCYLSIETAGNEQADDAYTYLDESPADPLVDALIFAPQVLYDRAAHTDVRADAQDYIESYQLKGGLAPWFLRGYHAAGTVSVTLWAATDAELPGIGDLLYLVQSEGSGDEVSDYAAILDMSSEVQTFETIQNSNLVRYERKLIYLTLTRALTVSLTGPEVAYTLPDTPDVLVRRCVVSDSARYYGRSSLTTAAEIGDTLIQVDSVYGYAVPSARGEAALAGLQALTNGAQTILSGGESFSVVGPVHTDQEAVTAATRRLIWTKTLLPIPGAGALVTAHVRILNRWYSVVEGTASSVGSITVNRTSGQVVLTLSALPDADTWLLWEWASAIHYTDRAGQSAGLQGIVIQGDLEATILRSTVSFSWKSGGVTKTASTAATGMVSGHGAGFVSPDGSWWLDISAHPADAGTNVTVHYTPTPVHSETFSTPSVTDGVISVTLADPPLAGSIQARWAVKHGKANRQYQLEVQTGVC